MKDRSFNFIHPLSIMDAPIELELSWTGDKERIVELLEAVIAKKGSVEITSVSKTTLAEAYSYVRKRESGTNYIFGAPQLITYNLHAKGNTDSNYWKLFSETPKSHVKDLSAIAPLNVTGERMASVLSRPIRDRIRARYEFVKRAKNLPLCERDLSPSQDRLFRLQIGILGSTPNIPRDDVAYQRNWTRFNPDLSRWTLLRFRLSAIVDGRKLVAEVEL